MSGGRGLFHIYSISLFTHPPPLFLFLLLFFFSSFPFGEVRRACRMKQPSVEERMMIHTTNNNHHSNEKVATRTEGESIWCLLCIYICVCVCGFFTKDLLPLSAFAHLLCCCGLFVFFVVVAQG
eukprot:gene1618-988_t